MPLTLGTLENNTHEGMKNPRGDRLAMTSVMLDRLDLLKGGSSGQMNSCWQTNAVDEVALEELTFDNLTSFEKVFSSTLILNFVEQ